MEHLTPWVTTMYYNDGSIYTNQWAEWTEKSKITGEVQTNNFHCWWKWEGDKIVSTACYFDTTDIDKEAVSVCSTKSNNIFLILIKKGI